MVARIAASLTAALVLAAAPARAADAPSDAPAGARLLTCHRSPSIDQRVAAVATRMRPIPGGKRLALKIDLWERPAGQRWTMRSDVLGLGGWTMPSDAQLGAQPGDVFKYRQAVGRLEVPAAYRFRVTFHWLAPDGRVVREAARTTAVCRQPDLRPDLVLRSVTVAATGSPGLVRYTLLVANAGRSPIVRAAIAATLPGETTPGLHTRSVRALVAGGTAVVRFVGPGCAAGAQPASFIADPSNAVDEANETNNVVSAACPAP